MKHLKKFNESKNDSEIYDKEDLESITRIVLDLENLIFDDLGIEIEKSDNFSNVPNSFPRYFSIISYFSDPVFRW